MKYVIMKLDTPNKNGRIYTREAMEKAVENAKLPMLGQIDMPRSDLIEFSSVSHQVTSLEIVGDNVLAEVEVFDTPNGQLLKQLLDANAGFTFRSCGYGDLKPTEDGSTVVENFELVSVNAVKDGA